jgi:hypothetical protein
VRLLVTGGRKFADRDFLFAILNKIDAKRRIDVLIEGGATGADRLARNWASARQVTFLTYEANWDRYGPNAGRIRNGEMFREGQPDLVVAFQGGTGTLNMVRIAEQAGARVLKTWNFKV